MSSSHYPGFGGSDDPVRIMALRLRAILAVNSTASVTPDCTSGSDPDFPEVDCDEVFPDLFLSNA